MNLGMILPFFPKQNRKHSEREGMKVNVCRSKIDSPVFFESETYAATATIEEYT